MKYSDVTDAALLRSLVENSFDLTTVSDREGNLLYVTPSVARILGYEARDVLGKNIMSFVHPDDLERVLEAFGRAIRMPGTLDPLVLRVRHSDQSWRVVEAASNNLLDDPSVAGIVHNMRDITARHEAEMAVRLNERKLRAYLDEATDLIWTIDLQGRLTSVNAMACAVLGYTAEELVGRPALELVASERVPELAVALAEVIQGHSIEQVEAEVITKQGNRVWLEIRGRTFREGGAIVEILQIARDITERKQSEQALRASEALYRSILDSSPDAVAITDMEGRVEIHSPSALLMFGYKPTDILHGRSVLEFLAAADRDRALANILKMPDRPADRSQRVPDEYRAIRADGSTFHVEVLGEFIRTEAGQPTGMVFDVRDITERRAAEAERARLESALAQAQKLEAVGRLAGGVAHDFNNMLGVILASAELALAALDPASPAREELGEIREAAERSAHLTRQLLAFASKQAIAPGHLDLNETVARILTMLRRLVREDIRLVWKPNSRPCPVFMDPGQVDQILTNLVVNARDSIRGEGTITIAVSPADIPQSPDRPFPEAPAGQYVVLSVRDDGCGMDGVTRERMFEPFFTTKQLGQGTGLGLATVYGIAQQNGGFVEVETEPGDGTAMSVYVPRREPLPAALGPHPNAADQPAGTGTILLVEDEAALLRLTAKMLDGLGYTILTSEDPRDALKLAEAYPGAIDLLVTDVTMPGMNGFELWKQLKAVRPALRCLFMSGYSAAAIAQHSDLGATLDLLPKPFSREALANRVREVFARP